MTLPKHLENVPDDREAYAPYNFVPLPERVVLAELPLPTHDTYHTNRHTGHIICTLTTASPLYVRCGHTPADYASHGDKSFHELTPDQQRKRAQFFHYDDPSTPVIPGSSLRGMLRALVEIASYGKMERVMDRQLFYRSVGDENYQQLFVENCGNVTHAPNPPALCYRTRVHSGFLRQRGGTYEIEECDYARIDQRTPNVRHIAAIPSLPNQPLMVGNRGAGQTPNWAYQHRPIYVNADAREQDYFFPRNARHPRDLYLRFRAVQQASFSADQNAQQGTLVITGHMQNKHLEFVFLHNSPSIEPRIHQIDQAMIQRFEDDDQITPWQEDAFLRDKPHTNARRGAGHLRDGEPVFFLLNDDGSIRFFGRAQLFRLPYGNAPFDFIPETHHTPTVIDIAEAIFGFVRRKKQEGVVQTVAGRIFVGDGRFADARDGVWLNPNEAIITPRILGSPKPTTYQHYLVQPESTQADRKKIRRYDSSRNITTIRGYKLYWHKGRVDSEAIRETNVQKVQNAPKQYTQFRPVKDGVSFTFDIHFENLSDVELGALLWVLLLAADKDYRLKIGMGKPLGMGAVSIQHTLHLCDRAMRYGQLFGDKRWSDGERILDAESQGNYINAFGQYVLRESGERVMRLSDTLRIRCLLALLSWPGPHTHATRYMEIDRDKNLPDRHRPGRENNDKINEYSDRLVLPDPREVLKTHPAPTPPPPPVQRNQLAIGMTITGNRNGEIRTPFGRGIQVDLNLKAFEQPKGKTVVGFIPKSDAGGSTSGGFSGLIESIEVDNTTVYVILKPKPKGT